MYSHQVLRQRWYKLVASPWCTYHQCCKVLVPQCVQTYCICTYTWFSLIGSLDADPLQCHCVLPPGSLWQWTVWPPASAAEGQGLGWYANVWQTSTGVCDSRNCGLEWVWGSVWGSVEGRNARGPLHRNIYKKPQLLAGVKQESGGARECLASITFINWCLLCSVVACKHCCVCTCNDPLLVQLSSPLKQVLYSFLPLLLQNIRVVAKYYTRISLHRLSELLSLSADVSHWDNIRSTCMYCDIQMCDVAE